LWKERIIVPVPIDKKELKIKGYNSTKEIAKNLAAILKFQCVIIL